MVQTHTNRIVLAAALSVFATSAQAQTMGAPQIYPNKPIRLVTSAAGGGNDFTARLIAQALSPRLGHQVIVDNRNSLESIDIAIKAPSDGYTLLVAGSALWVRPLLQKMSYDPTKDIAPVTVVGTSPNVLVVHPSVPATSVRELIDYAKAKPGALNYSSGPPGTTQHLAGELFKALAKVNIQHVPYKGAGPALIAVTANEVQMMITTAGSVTPHMKAGRVRALAVSSAGPSMLVPGLPTIAAALPGYDIVSIDGVFAPTRTPVAVIARLQKEIAGVVRQPEVSEKLLATGVEPVGSAPQELAIRIQSETAMLRKVIKDANIRAE